jgi:hypothetical protein
VAERQVLRDAIDVRLVNGGCATEIAAALGVFGLRQMAFARACAQNFSASRNLEPLGHGLFRFNTFRTSHKFNQLSFKKSAQYKYRGRPAQAIISTFEAGARLTLKAVEDFARSA